MRDAVDQEREVDGRMYTEMHCIYFSDSNLNSVKVGDTGLLDGYIFVRCYERFLKARHSLAKRRVMH